MGLFDKKFCDICGEKIGLLGNRKLEDGNLCKNCAKKLSPWFDERRHSTVAQIKQQLEYREGNRSKAAAFRTSRTFGKGSTRLYVDDNARKFAVHKGSDFAAANPDILDFSQATGCDLEIKEHSMELKRTVDGRSVSYNPPRYEYYYDFHVTVRVNHPYFSDMAFDLNSGSVHTGEVRMSVGGNNGAWRVSSSNGSYGETEYLDLVQMGNDLKAMIDGWKNGGGKGAAAANDEQTIRFGTPEPIPYAQATAYGTVSLMIRYFGTMSYNITDPGHLQQCGGSDLVMEILLKELRMFINRKLQGYSEQGVSFSLLPAYSKDIAAGALMEFGDLWMRNYGVQMKGMILAGFALTEESKEAYMRIKNGQNMQGDVSPAAQPQAPAASAQWQCEFCGTQNTGRFCTNCGAKQPE